VSPGNRPFGKTGVAPKRGKAVNIYLHQADQVRIRDLAAYLANEGQRVSDSQIIKAALLLAQPDKRLFKAYLEIREADQRYKREPEE
jgi:superfamily II DNA/RNA helicase